MKPRHAATLALMVLASCGPNMATIDAANERAERAAERSQAAQLRAEHSEELAEEIEMKTRDEETVLCGVACDSCHGLTGVARQRYEFYRAFWYEACTGRPWPYPVKGLSN
jgi:hypothetical protein